jgi:hypothetical protein
MPPGLCVAAAAFVVLCVLVLRAVPYLLGPDDYAYRAPVVAMTGGHVFTLSGAQAHACRAAGTSAGRAPAGSGWRPGPVGAPAGRQVDQRARRIRATRTWPWRSRRSA